MRLWSVQLRATIAGWRDASSSSVGSVASRGVAGRSAWQHGMAGAPVDRRIGMAAPMLLFDWCRSHI